MTSENLEDNESRIISPTVGNTQNEYVEPLIGTEHAPHVVRPVSSDPEEPALPSSGVAILVRPASRRSVSRVHCIGLPLTRVNAWPVAKMTSMLSIAVAIIQVTAPATVWVLLDVVGTFSQITQIVSSTGLGAGGFDLKSVLSLTAVVSGVIISSIVEVVIFTPLATIAALIYNMVSSLVGGVYVVLGDD